MTLISFLLEFLPGAAEIVLVNSRLAGFFQYPNTFAAFLLAGLALQAASEKHKLPDYLIDASLLFGLLCSGSRAALLIAIVPIGYSFIRHHKFPDLCFTVATLVVCFLGYFLFTEFVGTQARYTTISIHSGTFLARLLYYKDALRLIASHPFGLGWWGYKAMLGGIQTGRYAVSFVHSGLLQLLLDFGWLPTAFFSVIIGFSLFGKKTNQTQKLLLVTLLLHCMVDFDLQYLSIWTLLLAAILPYETNRTWRIKAKFPVLVILPVLLSGFCLWLGAGDVLYQSGNVNACLTVMPFHTEALQIRLSRLDNADTVDACAKKILDLNAYSAYAWSGEANAAFSKGDISRMITCKQNAIHLNRYATEEYIDYFEKLYTAIQLFEQNAGTYSSSYCLKELQSIPETMHQITETTDSLAVLSGEDQALELPADYLSFLNSIPIIQ